MMILQYWIEGRNRIFCCLFIVTCIQYCYDIVIAEGVFFLQNTKQRYQDLVLDYNEDDNDL